MRHRLSRRAFAYTIKQMHIVHVDIQVKREALPDFLEAIRDNAAHSIQEPGILRFDVLQDQGDACHFMLYEVYEDADAHASHRTTGHYLRWRETVEPMMARERVGTKLTNIVPSDPNWNSAG